MRFRVCSLSSSFGNFWMDNLRQGRAIRGISEHSEGKDGESTVAILRFLYGSLCLCRLRIEGLVLISKY
jgi:hypothetical protein